MHLDDNADRLLGTTQIGMLAVNSRLPLVNPAAFHYSSGSVWITTSRYAVKLAIATRDPRAAFLVHDGRRSLLLQGTIEPYDPLSIRGQVRAALDAPSVYWSMLGYTVKNARFVGGYLVDLARIPSEWWPQNRVVLRLRAERAWSMAAPEGLRTGTTTVPGVGGRLGLALGKLPIGYACWISGGTPVLAPALWTETGGHVAAACEMEGLPAMRASGSGALVIESHHRFRATRMSGACVRGHLTHGTEADREAIAARYEVPASSLPPSLHLEADRVTTWSGFEVHTVSAKPVVSAPPSGPT